MIKRFCAFIIVLFALAGCAHLEETAKVLWGSSTKALEKARPNATVRSYGAPRADCFNEVLKVAEDGHYTVFIQDRHRPLIVFVRIPGNINTTEVGVFFTSLTPSSTQLEVVSLSSLAQETVAQDLFANLDKAFPLKETL